MKTLKKFIKFKQLKIVYYGISHKERHRTMEK
jgi:hypothetical protein